MTKLGKDIHHNWLNVIRRIQSCSRSKNVVNCAIVSVNVVINERGEPIIWAEPKVTLIEPMQENSKLIDLLTEVL